MVMTGGPVGDEPTEFEAHERRTRELANMLGKDPHSFESVMDNADMAYALAHDAGLMRDKDGKEEPFVWPSVRREQLYQEEMYSDRPPEIGSSSGYDPRLSSLVDYNDDYQKSLESNRKFMLPWVGLARSDYPFAILEDVNDNDTFGGGFTSTCLGCQSLDEAKAYCERVGYSHEVPGPGEGDGVYTVRTIYDNPNFLEQQNAALKDPDPEKVESALETMLTIFNLSQQDIPVEFSAMKSVVELVDTWNRRVSETMRSEHVEVDREALRQKYAENKEKYGSMPHSKWFYTDERCEEEAKALELNLVPRKRYLKPEVRERYFNYGNGVIRRELDETIKQVVQSMDGWQPLNYSAQEHEAFKLATGDIVEALQTRYELRSTTAAGVQTALAGLMYIARLHSLGVQVFESTGYPEAAQEWEREVEVVVGYTVDQIEAKYGSTIAPFMKNSLLD